MTTIDGFKVEKLLRNKDFLSPYVTYDTVEKATRDILNYLVYDILYTIDSALITTTIGFNDALNRHAVEKVIYESRDKYIPKTLVLDNLNHRRYNDSAAVGNYVHGYDKSIIICDYFVFKGNSQKVLRYVRPEKIVMVNYEVNMKPSETKEAKASSPSYSVGYIGDEALADIRNYECKKIFIS